MNQPDFDASVRSPNSSTILQIPNPPPSPTPSQVEKLKMSPSALPERLVQGRKLFKKTPWFFYMTTGMILTLFSAIPCILIFFFNNMMEGDGAWYEKLKDHIKLAETFRWSILSSFYVFIFFNATAFFSTFPVAFKHSGETLRTTGQVAGGLRIPLAVWISASFTLLFFYGWKLNYQFSDEMLGKVAATVDSTSSHINFRIVSLFIDMVFGIFTLFIDLIISHRNYLLSIPTILFTFSSMLLVQQSLMLYTSYTFHQNFYTKRILENNLVLSAIEALNRKFPVPGCKPVKAGSVLEDEVSDKVAEAIFHALSQLGRQSVVMDDLLPYLEHPTAVAFFDFLDSNQSGDLTLEEFQESFRAAYETKNNLNKSIKANEEVLDKIDNFFITLLVIVKLAMISEKFSGSILGFLALFGSALFTVKTSFSDVFSVFANSMTHFLLTHPYDIGDKVRIDKKIYRVKNMNLWMTTLAEPSGRVVYATNSSMADTVFGNYRRSDRQDESLNILMPVSISKDLLEAYLGELNTFVKSHHRYFADRVVLKNCNVCNSDAMCVEIAFRHQGNFNNDDQYNFRRRMMFNQMRLAAKTLGINVFSMRFKD